MERDELYQEHLSEMFGNRVIEDYSDEEIMRVLKRLISCIPNGGKLYKYRPIEGQTFDYAYDALKNGYIWLSTADQFNDDEDCTLLFAPETEAEALKEYLYSHIDVVIKRIAYLIRKGEYDAPACTADVLKCFDKTTGRIKKKKAVNFLVKQGYNKADSQRFVLQTQKITDDFFSKNSDGINGIVADFLHFNQNNRSKSYVYSLSETYDTDTMWAYYAYSNKGFCIEYDFSKALLLPPEARRLLISTYKVIYKETKEPFSFIHILDYILQGQQDTQEFQKVNYEMLTRMITKRAEWQTEKEWRIYLYNVEHRLNTDLVSRIILDERIANTENAKKLISLAKERGWDLTVRTKNDTLTAHRYIPYQEWEQRRQKNA